jgi:hypothetical protein
MAKMKKGESISPKGKPAGKGKETQDVIDGNMFKDPRPGYEIAEKYTENYSDQTSANVHVRHVNRTPKKERVL